MNGNDCTGDCYVRWTTGTSDKLTTASPEGKVLFQEAHDTLFAYDLVIVEEWLVRAEYIKGLESFFGDMPGLEQPKSFCDPKSSDKANQANPLVNQTETRWEELARRNEVDTRLYDKLVTCEDGVIMEIGPAGAFHFDINR